MKSFSQAGQDLFVDAVLDHKRNGTFLDIGCCHPFELSNTYALESERGWKGMLVDNDPGAWALCAKNRKSHCVCGDATKLDYLDHFELARMPHEIDYLSLDVDAATLSVLQKLPLLITRFTVITIEHDSYRFGPGPRDAMRDILHKAGYKMVCRDVQSSDGTPFEDWWVDLEKISLSNFDKFHCRDKPWPQILKQGGIEL